MPTHIYTIYTYIGKYLGKPTKRSEGLEDRLKFVGMHAIHVYTHTHTHAVHTQIHMYSLLCSYTHVHMQVNPHTVVVLSRTGRKFVGMHQTRKRLHIVELYVSLHPYSVAAQVCVCMYVCACMCVCVCVRARVKKRKRERESARVRTNASARDVCLCV